MQTEDTEALRRQGANQARSKPDTVDQPVKAADTFVHDYNGTQHCIGMSVIRGTFLQNMRTLKARNMRKNMRQNMRNITKYAR